MAPRVHRFRNGRTKVGPPITPETINNRLRIARSIWNRARKVWADECPPLADIAWSEVMCQERDRDPLDHYQPPAVRTALINALGERSAHARLALEIAAETGLRIGPVLSLDYELFDFDRGIYRVRSKGRGGGRWLVKPITKRLYKLLTESGVSESGPIITFAGRPVRSIRKAVNLARKRAGLRRFTAKHLRHSTAIEILATGGTLTDAQAALDHSDPSLTSRVYGRLDVERVREVMERRDEEMSRRSK